MKSTILLAFFPLWIFAQPHLDDDIKGTWKGYVKTAEKKLSYELVIGDKKGVLTAFSKIVFDNNGVEYFAIKSVLIKKEKERYIFEEDRLLSDNFNEEAPKKVRQVNTLEINNSESEIILSGSFKTKPNKQLRVATGDVSVSKSVKPDSSGLYAELNKLGLVKEFRFDANDPIESGLSDISLPNQKTVKAEPLSPEVSKTTPATIISGSQINVTTPLPEADLVLSGNRNTPKKIDYELSLPKHMTIKKNKIKNLVVRPVPLKAKNTIVATPKPTPATIVAKTTPPPTKIASATPTSKNPVVQPIAAKSVEKPAPAVVQNLKTEKPAPPKPVVASGSASELDKRKIETIQTIYFKSDSLKLTLYDNGEVDGDTVSVVVNGNVLMGKKGLSTKAITETLYITPETGDSLQMVMYAENLGSIGNNTGLLIITDGKDRYEVRFSGDLNKNAAVILKRRK